MTRHILWQIFPVMTIRHTVKANVLKVKTAYNLNFLKIILPYRRHGSFASNGSVRNVL